MSRWYFAYGANMSPETLVRRGVTPVRSIVARLDGYVLCFSHRGLVCTGPAFANIERKEGGTVYGVLHQLPEGELTHLDRIEGAEYQHRDIEVETEQEGVLRARAYIDPYPVAGLKPSRRYASVCISAARLYGFPPAYIESLERCPTTYIPVASELTTFVAGFAERIRRMGVRPEVLRMRILGQRPRRER